jgi:large subunit ribosomal protein L29
MTKAKDLRNESDDQLLSMIADGEKQLFEYKNEMALSHKVEKSHRIREKRRDVARMKTILAERKLKEEGAKASGKR